MMATMGRILMILMVVAALAGCGTNRLNFGQSFAYNTPNKVDDALIVSFPDALIDEVYKIQIGEWWHAQYYEVPIAEAYISELRARFGPMFRGGMTITTNETLALAEAPATAVGIAPSVASSPISSELDRILAEMEEKEARNPDDPVIPSDAELAPLVDRQRQGFYDASIEELRRNNAQYILRINQALFDFQGARCRVLANVTLIDRRTGVILINARNYPGRSSTLNPNDSEKTNTIALERLTRLALANAMIPLVDDVATAVGAK